MDLNDTEVFTQGHPAENRPRRQDPGHEFISPHPSLRLCHKARQDPDGHHSLQQGQDRNISDQGFSMRSCPAPHPDTVPQSLPRLSNEQSTITTSEHHIDDSFFGLYGNISTSSNFTRSFDLIFPLTNLPLLPDERTRHPIGPFNSTTVTMPLENSFPMVNLHHQRTFKETVSAESSGFDSFNNIAMLNEGFLSPTNNSFNVGQAGRYHILPPI